MDLPEIVRSPFTAQTMKREDVLQYFNAEGVVTHYADAAARIGLWASEEKIFTRLFQQSDSLLELGCGAGRIAFGLHELGYRNIMATDYSKAMIERARHLSTLLEYNLPLQVADATDLKFDDNDFDGAIFGFNGLMQIPGIANREQALREVYRVIRPGAWFVFTSHDRESGRHQAFWDAETERWAQAKQRADLDDFGDRAEATAHGTHFMHVPVKSELETALHAVGFRLEVCVPRSALANESMAVREFSDDCLFWVVQKPETPI